MRYIVVGAGLAGSEAALQLAARGHAVDLYEMRPEVMTPAHETGHPAELVCSNSLRSAVPYNAPGLLKEELRRAGSFLIRAADSCAVPAGGALAVDRMRFSHSVMSMLLENRLIRLIRTEVTSLPEGSAIIAAGPLASPALADALSEVTGSDRLYFYDAIAPVLSGNSLNSDRVFRMDRYGEPGSGDYLNCPLSKDEYLDLVQSLRIGERVPARDFEDETHFQGCMPVEALADSGDMTLAHGPMKPVGLMDPRTAARPFAVVQLRMENADGTAWNMVGFQTKLKYGEQKRIFSTIPGLEEAEFLRYGSMHRNTYINGPVLLDHHLRLRARPSLLFAGQITGVEGYIESMASGLLAGLFASGVDSVPPEDTALGALLKHSTHGDGVNYQPSNINYGLFPPARLRGGRKARRQARAEAALKSLERWLQSLS